MREGKGDLVLDDLFCPSLLDLLFVQDFASDALRRVVRHRVMNPEKFIHKTRQKSSRKMTRGSGMGERGWIVPSKRSFANERAKVKLSDLDGHRIAKVTTSGLFFASSGHSRQPSLIVEILPLLSPPPLFSSYASPDPPPPPPTTTPSFSFSNPPFKYL